MKSRIAVLLFSLAVLCSCKKENTQTVPSSCIDKSLINVKATCTMDYRPVCGCDGKTYSNACVAKTTAGVTGFKEGACKR